MAQSEQENLLGFIDKRHVKGQTTDHVTTAQNFSDVASLRTRLTAISGTTYTAARLDQMTKNDMVYAVRMSDEAAGIN